MSLFAGNEFFQTLLSRNKEYYKDYSVPADFPYVIHSDGVPPILFFDAEHIDLQLQNQPKALKSVFIHMFVHHIPVVIGLILPGSISSLSMEYKSYPAEPCVAFAFSRNGTNLMRVMIQMSYREV